MSASSKTLTHDINLAYNCIASKATLEEEGYEQDMSNDYII